MFRRTEKLHKEGRTREDYERDAALILEQRIAEGRPPPDVWRKAAEWRAKKGHPAGWYTAGSAPAASRPDAPRAVVPMAEPLVLRVVRYPSPAATTSVSEAGSARPRVVNASTEYRP